MALDYRGPGWLAESNLSRVFMVTVKDSGVARHVRIRSSGLKYKPHCRIGHIYRI